MAKALKTFNIYKKGIVLEMLNTYRNHIPKIALLPIGGHYVMGPKEAAVALTLIEPEIVIPMHYKTFPVLEQDAQKFIMQAEKIAPSVKVKIIEPGDSFIYP